jgi:hypothetical protein
MIVPNDTGSTLVVMAISSKHGNAVPTRATRLRESSLAIRVAVDNHHTNKEITKLRTINTTQVLVYAIILNR